MTIDMADKMIARQKGRQEQRRKKRILEQADSCFAADSC